MKHRFSNSKKLRHEILKMALHNVPPYSSWEQIPQNLRVSILEHIQQIAEEVVNESAI